jgi:hypothetical protein
MKRCVRHVWLLVFPVVLLMVAPSAGAGNLLEQDIAALPAYARVERPFGFHTDDWAIITWYRSPEWVLENRRNFNLLDLFDVPDAFDAPLMIDGMVIWDPPLPTPIFMLAQGLPGMPAWIVSWPELQHAMANDKLTIAELLRMDSLRVGECTLYHETLHPLGTDNPVSHEIVANGFLEDGATFQYHYVHGQLHDGVGNAAVKIDIMEP